MPYGLSKYFNIVGIHNYINYSGKNIGILLARYITEHIQIYQVHCKFYNSCYLGEYIVSSSPLL